MVSGSTKVIPLKSGFLIFTFATVADLGGVLIHYSTPLNSLPTAYSINLEFTYGQNCYALQIKSICRQQNKPTCDLTFFFFK